MTRLATDENATHWARRSNAHGGMATLDFRLRRIGEIGAMPLAGVDDKQPRLACHLKHRLAGRNRAGQQRDIVAERFPEAAGLQKIALHVDDNQRSTREVERDRLRLGPDRCLHTRLPE